MLMNPASLMVSLTVSTIGFGFFIYGRKQARIPQVVVGLGLMIYPYFIGGVAPMLAVGAALLGILWLWLRMGM